MKFFRFRYAGPQIRGRATGGPHPKFAQCHAFDAACTRRGWHE